jgi:hypothetical protein
LFVDVGSTTTDIVPICAGAICVEGSTDAGASLRGWSIRRSPHTDRGADRRIPVTRTWSLRWPSISPPLRISPDRRTARGRGSASAADNGGKSVRGSARRLARGRPRRRMRRSRRGVGRTRLAGLTLARARACERCCRVGDLANRRRWRGRARAVGGREAAAPRPALSRLQSRAGLVGPEWRVAPRRRPVKRCRAGSTLK